LSQDPIYSIKPSTHIRTHNAEVFFKLLNNHDKDLTFKHLVEIQKQSTHKETVEPELELKERTMTLLNVTEALGLKVGIKVSEDIDSHKQRAATTRQGLMRMLACYEEIVKEKKRFLSCQGTMLGFFKSSSGTVASPAVLLNIGDDDTDDPSAVQDEVPLS
jgi:hypothetical protein